jgi:hypothetical protein
MSGIEIARAIDELGPWFQMNLGGVPTAPEHFPGDYLDNLHGKSVLDIGCGSHAAQRWLRDRRPPGGRGLHLQTEALKHG